jgi:FkbM family methyltransferase
VAFFVVNALVRVVQRGIERALGVRIMRSSIPHGMDPLHDVASCFPKPGVALIIDVGAHVGVNALKFRQAFPAAEIHCYEPSEQNFQELSKNASHKPGIFVHRMALGNRDLVGVVEPSSLGTDLTRVVDIPGEPQLALGEKVEVRRLDTLFGDDRRINYLKIDAEGSDLKVLQGADRLLSEQRIDVIEVEAGIQRPGVSKRLVPFTDFFAFLEPYGYHLLGFYEQVRDWPRGLHRLRRSNLVFASDRVLKLNAWSSGYQVAEIDGEQATNP